MDRFKSRLDRSEIIISKVKDIQKKNQNQEESTENVKIYSVRDTENTLRRLNRHTVRPKGKEKKQVDRVSIRRNNV